MKWYLLALKKYAVFTGRASRQEFWMFVLFNIIFGVVAGLLDSLLGTMMVGAIGIKITFIGGLYNLAVFVPSLSVTVRRIHDIGKSGWVYARFLVSTGIITILYVSYFLYIYMTNDSFYATSAHKNFYLISALAVLVLIGFGIWLLVYLARPGDQGANKYGPDPIEPDPHPLDRLKD